MKTSMGREEGGGGGTGEKEESERRYSQRKDDWRKEGRSGSEKTIE